MRKQSSTQPVRQELTGFVNLLCKYNAIINGTQKELQTVHDLFFSRQLVLSPSDFKKALECLNQIDDWSRRIHSTIRQSIQLPLVVIPLRLPLLITLLDVQAQVAKLKQLVNLQREAMGRMPYQMLWNDVQREGVKPPPELAFRLFCYASLPNIWYSITWNSFYQTLEQRVAIQQGVDNLRLHCEEVLEQIDMLMEKLRYERHRTRFKKRVLIQ